MSFMAPVRTTFLALCLMSVPVMAQADSDFTSLIEQAGRAARAQQWDRAINVSRQAYSAAPNDYYRFEAATLMAELQERAGKRAAARNTLSAATSLLSPGDEMQRLLARQARLAFLDHDIAAARALSLQSAREAGATGEDWPSEGDGAVLLYLPAGLRIPASAGGLIRTLVSPARSRDDIALVRFDGLEAPISDAAVTVSWRFKRESHWSPEQALAQWQKRPNTLRDVAGNALPVPWDGPAYLQVPGASAARVLAHESPQDGKWSSAVWVARQGDWVLQVEAQWPAPADAVMRKSLADLFGAMSDWLPEPTHMQASDFDLRWRETNAAVLDEQWAQVVPAALAAQAGALFPAEHAYLAAALGVAHYQLGQDAAAETYLARAATYGKSGNAGSASQALLEQALLRQADLAYRKGNTQGGTEALTRYTRTQPYNGDLEPETGMLTMTLSGLALPPRIGNFLRQPDYDAAYYVALRPTTQRIGVTMIPTAGVALSIEDRMEQTLAWFDRRYAADVSKIVRAPFQAAGCQRAASVQYTFSRHESGRTVSVNPEQVATGERIMGFWFCQNPERETLLRTEWAAGDGRAQASAEAFAQAFPWGPPAAAMKMGRPVNGGPSDLNSGNSGNSGN